ncbi:hypothetical protein [Nonomuraea recticatena]|uniref:hypothetical protein n=1 Tax=Nonomuraea recticatena TaxID=46178 RepID=UPI00361AFD1C
MIASARRSASTMPSATSSRPSEARPSQASRTPLVSSASLTNTLTTTVPSGVSAEESTALPPAAWAVTLRPVAASRTASSRAAAAPSTPPPGRKTVTGNGPPRACSTVSDSAGEPAATATDSAVAVARDMAPFSATERISSAIGTSSAISTSEVIAAASSASHLLTTGPRA